MYMYVYMTISENKARLENWIIFLHFIWKQIAPHLLNYKYMYMYVGYWEFWTWIWV